MIQRLQSLYLLFAAVFVALFFVVGQAWQTVVAAVYPWLTAASIALGGLVVLFSLVSIFFYKDRANQRKLILAAQWLDLGLVVALVGSLAAFISANDTGVPVPVVLYVTLLFPVAAYVFLRLARRGVEKDIALVRSMDRLR